MRTPHRTAKPFEDVQLERLRRLTARRVREGLREQGERNVRCTQLHELQFETACLYSEFITTGARGELPHARSFT